jgi:hypothetical protein
MKFIAKRAVLEQLIHMRTKILSNYVRKKWVIIHRCAGEEYMPRSSYAAEMWLYLMNYGQEIKIVE